MNITTEQLTQTLQFYIQDMELEDKIIETILDIEQENN